MFLDHPQVIRGRKRRHPLRDQVVAGEPGPDLDQIARLPELRHGLSQDELDVAVLGAAGVVLPALDARLPRRTRRRGLLEHRLPFEAGSSRPRSWCPTWASWSLVSVVLAMRIPILLIKPHATGLQSNYANVKLKPDLGVCGEPYICNLPARSNQGVHLCPPTKTHARNATGAAFPRPNGTQVGLAMGFSP